MLISGSKPLVGRYRAVLAMGCVGSTLRLGTGRCHFTPESRVAQKAASGGNSWASKRHAIKSVTALGSHPYTTSLKSIVIARVKANPLETLPAPTAHSAVAVPQGSQMRVTRSLRAQAIRR